MSLTLTSNAFKNGDGIPSQYSCDGKDISPELQWNNAPDGTQSFALIFDDPDAPMGTWVHWVLFNIPANINQLSENINTLPKGTVVGNNSWGKASYGGPCPPDKEHRYFFKLYALDTTLDLPSGSTKKELEKAMQSHVLSNAELMGKYKR